LERVRALLAKAEDPAATPAEAEAFMAKATELMAKYGIERAMLGTHAPDSDKLTDRVFTTSNPWGAEKAKLLYWLADAMRCRPLMLGKEDSTARIHVFGYGSDLERVDLLFTSLLLQMTNGLGKAPVPSWESPRAYRRSWLIGFVDVVTARVKAAEQRAAAEAETHPVAHGSARTGSTALVLADRRTAVDQAFTEQYPRTRRQRTTYSGTGAQAGRAAGRTANIGQTGLSGGRRAIGGAR
jgi:hypothetical protein